MSDEDAIAELEEQVSSLQNRVAYLEAELETSYEEERFNRRMNSLIPGDFDVEIRDNQLGGYHARFSDIGADQLNSAIERLEFREDDYEWSMTETGSGIGLEVWTGAY